MQQTWVWHECSWRRSPLTPPQSHQNLHRTGKRTLGGTDRSLFTRTREKTSDPTRHHQEASISLLSFSIRGQTCWKPQSQKTNQSDTWTRATSNSMKLWAMPCRATQDGRVMVESSDRMWSTREGNGKPMQYSCLEIPMSSMKRQKVRTLKDELLRSVGAQYATSPR